MPCPFRRVFRALRGVSHRALLGGALALPLPVHAADLVVLTAGAYKPVLLDLIPAFEKNAGGHVEVSNDTAGGVAARIARGETVDLVVLPVAALDALTASGKIAAGSTAPLAKSGIGVVVKTGAPKPDISTVETFKAAILAAPSIAYIDPASGGSSGIYLAKLFQRLGIADQIQRKSVLVPGGLVASRVDNGEAALALQQISELRAVRGVTFVGPLPEEIQSYTVYGGGIPVAATWPNEAKALLNLLRGELAAKKLAARGLEKPYPRGGFRQSAGLRGGFAIVRPDPSGFPATAAERAPTAYAPPAVRTWSSSRPRSS